MRTIQRGFLQRIPRTFFQDNVATDLDALEVSILAEDGTELVTTDEGTFQELDIVANKTATTGTYFVAITPDATEAIGIWILYWRFTYGTGGEAETKVATEVLQLVDEDSVPQLVDNYLSLDQITRIYPDLFSVASPDEILRVGAQASRVLDSELDGRFSVPLRKRSDTGLYDQIVLEATALLAVHRILKPRYPEEAEGYLEDYEKRVDGINSGRFRLWEEITGAEIGFQTPQPASGNTSTNIELELDPAGVFSGLYHALLVVEIDGAGDIDTATYKVSIDGGKTWAVEEQAATDTWAAPAGCLGLSLRFFRRGSTGNLVDGDSWTIEAWPLDTVVTPTKGGIRKGKVVL